MNELTLNSIVPRIIAPENVRDITPADTLHRAGALHFRVEVRNRAAEDINI